MLNVFRWNLGNSWHVLLGSKPSIICFSLVCFSGYINSLSQIRVSFRSLYGIKVGEVQMLRNTMFYDPYNIYVIEFLTMTSISLIMWETYTKQSLGAKYNENMKSILCYVSLWPSQLMEEYIAWHHDYKVLVRSIVYALS